MDISSKGVDLIKEFEGYYDHAYNLGDGGWTIGYGTFNYLPNGIKVYEGMTCTESEAEQWLIEELAAFVTQVNNIAVSKFPSLNQNQFDALVSYAYNRGGGGLRQLVNNSSSIDELGNNITVYWGSNTTYYNGLMRRRRREQALFRDGNITPAEDDDPSTPGGGHSSWTHKILNVNKVGFCRLIKKRRKWYK